MVFKTGDISTEFDKDNLVRNSNVFSDVMEEEKEEDKDE